jgi:hypothetical protein
VSPYEQGSAKAAAACEAILQRLGCGYVVRRPPARLPGCRHGHAPGSGLRPGMGGLALPCSSRAATVAVAADGLLPAPGPSAGPGAGALAGRGQGQARGAGQRSQALGDVAGAGAVPQARCARRAAALPASRALRSRAACPPGPLGRLAGLCCKARAWRPAAGKFRAIGVSNYEERHLAELCGKAAVQPAVNQFEVHPRRQCRALRAACQAAGAVAAGRRECQCRRCAGVVIVARIRDAAPAGVAVVAYASLGCGDLLKQPVVQQVAAAAGRTPAQVSGAAAWAVAQPALHTCR